MVPKVPEIAPATKLRNSSPDGLCRNRIPHVSHEGQNVAEQEEDRALRLPERGRKRDFLLTSA